MDMAEEGTMVRRALGWLTAWQISARGIAEPTSNFDQSALNVRNGSSNFAEEAGQRLGPTAMPPIFSGTWSTMKHTVTGC